MSLLDAKVKLNAGQAKLVTLEPKDKFAARLAVAKELLVKEIATVKGPTRTTYRRLKVIRPAP